MTISHDELRKLAMTATPGPWQMQEYTVPGFDCRIINEKGDAEIGTFLVAGARFPENGRYIAAANPQTIIELLDEIERKNEALQSALGQLIALGGDPEYIDPYHDKIQAAVLAQVREALNPEPKP